MFSNTWSLKTGKKWQSLCHVLTAWNPLSHISLCDARARTLKTNFILSQLVSFQVLSIGGTRRKPESWRKETDFSFPVACWFCCLSSSPSPRQKVTVSVPRSGPLCSSSSSSSQQYSLLEVWAQLCQGSPLSFWSVITSRMISTPPKFQC